MLPAEAGLRNLISKEARIETIRSWAKEQNFPTLLQGGLELVEREESSLDEVARIAFFD